MNDNGTSVKVDFTFDVPCVWSYFAFTRLQRALTRFRAEGGLAEVVFHPFQLAPEATREGELKVEVLRKAFGGDPAQAVAEITELAADEGLALHHDKAIFSNTFEAHRLVALASSQGLGEQMAERLFRAHHTDELNVADPDTLQRLAAEVGVRWSDEGAARTRADLDRVRRSGIQGVPVLRFADQPATSGVPSEQAMLAALAGA